jgi:hypothetical protein
MQSRAIDLLLDMSWLRETEGGYQKAAPTRYAINPDYAALAEQERQRRALVRERIAESARERRVQSAKR